MPNAPSQFLSSTHFQYSRLMESQILTCIGSMESQILTYFGDMMFIVFLKTLNPMTPNNEFIPYIFRNFPEFEIPSTQILTKKLRNHKYGPKSTISCALCFQNTIYSVLWLFGVVFPKAVFGIDAIPNTDLIRRYAVCCVSIHSQPKDSKYWTYSVMCFQNTKNSSSMVNDPKFWPKIGESQIRT